MLARSLPHMEEHRERQREKTSLVLFVLETKTWNFLTVDVSFGFSLN
jgi:hypothetical protein